MSKHHLLALADAVPHDPRSADLLATLAAAVTRPRPPPDPEPIVYREPTCTAAEGWEAMEDGAMAAVFRLDDSCNPHPERSDLWLRWHVGHRRQRNHMAAPPPEGHTPSE